MTKDEVLARELVRTYDHLLEYEEGRFGNQLCSFILMSNDGTSTEIYLSMVCHSHLRVATWNKYDQILTSYPIRNSENDFAFFDFMKFTLYKKWADYIHLESVEWDDSKRYYIRISDLDKIPANIFYNICICSRFPFEHPTFTRVWKELCDQGVHPTIAFMVCKSDAGSDMDKIVSIVGYDNEHQCVYMTGDFNRLLFDGPEENCDSSFKSNPCYSTPTNQIWGNSTHLRQLTLSTISEFWNIWQQRIAEHETKNLLQSS